MCKLRIVSPARLVDILNHIIVALVVLALIPAGIVFLLLAKCAERATIKEKKELTSQ